VAEYVSVTDFHYHQINLTRRMSTSKQFISCLVWDGLIFCTAESASQVGVNSGDLDA